MANNVKVYMLTKEGTWALFDVQAVHADGALSLSIKNSMGVRTHQLAVPKTSNIVPQRLALCVMTLTGTDHTNRSRTITYELHEADTTFTTPASLYVEVKEHALRQLEERFGEEFCQHVVTVFYHTEAYPLPQFLRK